MLTITSEKLRVLAERAVFARSGSTDRAAVDRMVEGLRHNQEFFKRVLEKHGQDLVDGKQ